MSSEAWQDDNNRYLAASLQWLRLRLQRLVPEEPLLALPAPSNSAANKIDPEPPVPPVEKTSGKLSRWLGTGAPRSARAAASIVTPAPKEVLLLPDLSGMPLAPSAALAAAAEAREAAAKMDPPPALQLLSQRLGLSTFERDTLLLATAVEYDPGFMNLFAAAQGSSSRTYPTFGLALAALDDASWEALSAHRPLRQDRLIEINQPGATPLTSSPLRADERIVNFIKGLNVLDDRLTTLLTPVDTSRQDVAPSQQTAVESIRQRIHDAVEQSVLPVVQLIGSDTGSKLAVASQVCAALGRELYRVGAEALPQQAAESETLVRLWQRETFLLPVSLYIDAEKLDGASVESSALFERILSRGLGLVFLGVQGCAGARERPGVLR